MSENVVIKKDRTVTVPASEAKIGVQYDHNVNVITFDCPRYPDDDRNVDMSTMQIYINYMLPDKTLGSYLAENVKVDTNNPDTIHFDWKITRNVTQVKGALQALVCIKKVDAEGNELYHWNTDLIQSFRVGEGMECLETISSDYADVISQLLVNMNTVVGEFEALSADVTARTSEETLQGLVNNAASDEKLGSIVNAYMEANPVGINVDDTLTVSGDAADAKITGDRISELKSDLAELNANAIITNEEINPDNWFYDYTEGQVISSTGVITQNEIYATTGFIPVNSGDIIHRYGIKNSVSELAPTHVAFYTDNNDNSFLSRSNGVKTGTVVPSGAKYARLNITIASHSNYTKEMVTVNTVIQNVLDYSDYFTPYYNLVVDKENALLVGDELYNNELPTITVSGGAITITTNNGVEYVIKHITNTKINVNCWRIISCNKTVSETKYKVWETSDADGVIKISGEDDFIGGYHGNEQTKDIVFIIDGTVVDLDDTTLITPRKFSSLDLFAESDLYHCNTSALAGTKAFERSKRIHFSDNKITVSNEFTALSSMDIEKAYTAMLSIDKSYDENDVLLGYVVNSDYKYHHVGETVQDTERLNKCTVYTTYGILTMSANKGSNQYYRGSVVDYPSTNRMKWYMGSIFAKSNDPVPVSIGEVIWGEYELLIE